MKRIFKKPYLYLFLIVFFGYLLLNILVSGFNNTIPLIIIYASTVNWFKLSLSILFTIIIAFLVALNLTYILILHKERMKCKKQTAVASAGSIGGLIAGV